MLAVIQFKKFVHLKQMLVFADARLLEDDWARAGKLRPDGGKEHHRAGKHDEHQRGNDIKQTLDYRVSGEIQRRGTQA